VHKYYKNVEATFKLYTPQNDMKQQLHLGPQNIKFHYTEYISPGGMASSTSELLQLRVSDYTP
jgi:hypothetical protein